MPVTLAQVARAAGVSVATASRAFNRPDRLSAEMRERVLRVASELDYHAVRRVDGIDVGLVVPDMINAVMSTQVSIIQEQAWRGKHRVTVASTAEEPVRERQVLESLRSHVDGLILISPRIPTSAIQAAIGSIPLVVINGATTELCPTFLLTSDTGIRQSMEHLVALGHRKLAFVPGPPQAWANNNRHAATVTMAKRFGVELTVLGNQAASIQGGLAAAASVVASGATAVITYNDLVALGVRTGARNLGVSCPEELSIIGIDDFIVAAMSQPPLTTVHLDFENGCRRAFDVLLDLVEHKKVEPEPEFWDSQLIIRESTGRAPAANRPE